MPVRRGRRSFNGSRARRRLVWATSFTFNAVANNANVNLDLLANLKVAGSSVLGVTVVRTHMRFAVQWPPLTNTFQGLAVGLVVQSMDAVNLTQIDLSQDQDWALRDTFLPGTGVNHLSPITPFTEGFTVDLKAKRRVDELNESWALAYSLQNSVGNTIPVSVFARTLVALP